MSAIIWAVAVVWVLCGVTSYGLTNAYFYRAYPAQWRPVRRRLIHAIDLPLGMFGLFGTLWFLHGVLHPSVRWGFKL